MTIDKEAIALAKQKAKDNHALAKQDSFTQLATQFKSFDWRNVPPPAMATLLTRIPHKGRYNEPDWYMTPEQAFIHALRCYNLGVDPTSKEVWFNRDTWETNLTAEGQRKVSGQRGAELGPPHFVRVERDWPEDKKNPNDLEKDVGFTCEIEIKGYKQPVNYTAWLSEWYMAKNPNWSDRTEHMLQVRASDKCYEFATGVGISNTVDTEPPEETVPPIKTSEVEFTPPEVVEVLNKEE